jgi:membrane-associated protein
VHTDLAVNLLNAKSLLSAFGMIGVIAITYVETGLLVGLFLPGDSVLFLSGVACAGSLPNIKFNLAVILIGTIIAAIAGGQTSYAWGRKAGPLLFRREDSRLFKQSYLVKAGEYLARYGAGKAIFLARFLPGIRALISPILGAAKHDAKQFAIWNAVSGLCWPIIVVMLGWGLGKQIGKNANVDQILLPIVVALAIISVLPTVVEVMRERRRHRLNADAATDAPAADVTTIEG